MKPLDRTTAVVEVWERDLLIVEVFARCDGTRHFHFVKEAAGWGPHWDILSKIAAKVFELLDVADEAMRQARHELGN